MNLKRETEMMLKQYYKGVDDIVWLGEPDVIVEGRTIVNGYRVSNRHMLNYLDVEYDDTWGMDEIPSSLVVVGEDWWLERVERDGHSGWEFKTLPQPPRAIVERGTI